MWSSRRDKQARRRCSGRPHKGKLITYVVSSPGEVCKRDEQFASGGLFLGGHDGRRCVVGYCRWVADGRVVEEGEGGGSSKGRVAWDFGGSGALSP